jgi:hypothetical protein
MSRKARSAKGKMVDFDLLKIKQQLSTTPVTVDVSNRRKFIDTKDGIKRTENYIVSPTPVIPQNDDMADMLAVGKEAAEVTANAHKVKK